MSKTTKGIIAVVAVAAVAAGVYLLLNKGKRNYADVIIKSGMAANYPILITFDSDYLKEWASAIKRNQPQFEYNGKMYNTNGGKLKTN